MLTHLRHYADAWIKRVTRQVVESETTPWGEIPRIPDEWERCSRKWDNAHRERNNRE